MHTLKVTARNCLQLLFGLLPYLCGSLLYIECVPGLCFKGPGAVQQFSKKFSAVQMRQSEIQQEKQGYYSLWSKGILREYSVIMIQLPGSQRPNYLAYFYLLAYYSRVTHEGAVSITINEDSFKMTFVRVLILLSSCI